jgi:hypothetical protein
MRPMGTGDEREDAVTAAIHDYACDRRRDALVAWVDAALAPVGGRLFEGYSRRKEVAPDA